MGYTAAVLLVTVMFAPVLLIVAALLLLLARKLGMVPGGSGAIVGYMLLFCGSFGLLFLGITADMLALTPARLQVRYIGQTAAGSNMANFRTPIPDGAIDSRRRGQKRSAAAASGTNCRAEGEFAGSLARWTRGGSPRSPWKATSFE